jgi:hypothetical protein
VSCPRLGHVAALFLSLAGLSCSASPVVAGEASTETLRDFMIQNVCLDGAGRAVGPISPVDGDRRCVGQRDLRPGENLPYHKHDHPVSTVAAIAPHGYQRHDSFPVETAQFGVVIEHSFDFGDGAGRRFGFFDAGRGDGGDITLLTAQAASFAATEDGGGGFQLFVGPDCREEVGAAAIAGSWIIALLDPGGPLRGETVARLRDLKEGRQSKCPTRLNAAFTRWHVQPMTYRSAEGQGTPFTTSTLISEHYGGEHPESADHVERFYFTRELGSTRWERWQNLSHNRDFTADQLGKAAADLNQSRRCSAAETPSGGVALVMIDCREWTRIEPSDSPEGDRPGFFVDALRSRHLASGFFAAPSQ